jgi:hypothetical protein
MMGSEILRTQGWEVVFLGGSLPADDLQRFAAEREPDVVVISCTVPLYLAGARRCFNAIAAIGLPALGAGAAFGRDASRALRLGARGWLGPGLDLAALLRDAEATEPMAWPTPPEALALELDHQALEESCLSMMAAQLPSMRSYSPEQLLSTAADVAYIVGFLTTSVGLDDDEIFLRFVDWLAGVLSSRGVPGDALRESLRCIGTVMGAAGMQQAARLCSLGSAAVAAS